ncbi:hypothetical protein P4G83_28750 [Bacillus cereus]|nr:hypothetical protein [Bacillus cereus]
MNLKGLLAKISDGQVISALNDFFYERAADFHPTEGIGDRIKELREKVPDELTDLFLELDEAYVDFMAAQNIEIYKKGFSECLQLILSTAATPLFEQKGENIDV